MDNNFNQNPPLDNTSNTNQAENPPSANPQPAPAAPISSAFGSDAAQRTMNSNGQQILNAYQFIPNQPMQSQLIPPQYQPMQGQPVPPQYQPMQGQPVPPQYQPMQSQPVPPQYQPMQYPVQPMMYMPPNYYMQYQPVVVPVVQPIPQPYTKEAKKLYRTHCSRVGLTIAADVGIMLGVQLVVMFAGIFGYSLLQQMGILTWLDSVSAYANITMFASAVSALVANLTPSSAHGHKWKIKFTDPFKGDKLKFGFIISAAIAAVGLNFMWGVLYNYVIYPPLQNFIDSFLPRLPEEAAASSSPAIALWIMVIWTCVIAPITEEYMFRGIIMRTLSKYGATFGIVASAFLFGIWHGNLAQAPMAFLIGLVMGYVATKSGNIRQAIAIHAFNNTFVTIPSVVEFYFPEMLDMVENIYVILDFCAMVFAVIALIYFAVCHHKGKKARKQRIQTGSPEISSAEKRLIDLEIPEERRKPEFVFVKHKVLHLLTSGGMIFFLCIALLETLINTLAGI